MKCVILSAGQISDYGLMKQYIGPGDYIIAADGGCRHLAPLGVKADFVLGDFDSLGYVPEEAAEVYSPRKDDTDTMLAVKHGLLKGWDDFAILGGLGGRLDHTAANITALEYLRSHGVHGILADETTVVRIFGPGDIIRPSPDRRAEDYFSLFPFGCPYAVVSISGVMYPLERFRLNSDFPLGVSNHVTDPEKFSMTIHEGTVAVMECREKSAEL